MKPITAESFEGRALLALRAGAMSAEEASERWPTCGTRPFQALLKLGYVDYDGDRYALTPAGRAACPCRNPLAAKAAPAIHSPEVFTMPKGETRITRDQVLAAITEAGAAGLHRKDLIARFKCPESTLDNHLMHLARGNNPAIFRPRPGQCVASFLPVAEQQADPAPLAEEFAFEPTPAAPAEPEEIEAEQIEVTAVGDRRGPIVIGDADDLDIGMFSSGRLEISVGRDTVVIEPAAMKKLRGFLGLFQEGV